MRVERNEYKMKKCIVCKREIQPETMICPYCSANQNEKEQTKTIFVNDEGKDSKGMQESSTDIFNMFEEGITEEAFNIPREIIAEEVTEMPREEMNEEAFNILGEETKKTEKEENRILGEEHMENSGIKRCSNCKRVISSKDKFCTYCGTKVEFTPNGNSLNNNDNGTVIKEPKTQGNLLKYYGIILGVIFGYFAITYLPCLSYYGFSAKIWGFLMIVACVWSAFIYFMIAFRCKRQYGKHLVCALAGGAILKLILQIIMLQQYSTLVNTTSLSFVTVIITILGVVLCYYLMKSEGMILTQKQKSLQQIIIEIPVVLRNIISQGQTTVSIRRPGTGNTHRPVVPNTLQGQTAYFISGGLFLTFCILYTLNLMYDVVFHFSYLALVMNIFCILSCVAVWLLYYSSRKNELHTTALSIITVTTYIKLGLHAALIVGSIILLIAAGVDMVTILVIFVISLLDIAYWCSLGAIFSDAKKFSIGEKDYIKVRRYPIIIKGFRVAIQVIGFIIAAISQYFANFFTDSMYQFQEGTSSSFGSLFDNPILEEFGLGYDYWHDEASSFLYSLIQPIVQWVQDVFGFSKNPIFMIIAIAITIIEMILLSKMRSLMKANNPQK